MSIQQAERALYDDVWASVPHYDEVSPGEHYAPLFAEIAEPGQLVLDAGTGTGKGALALQRCGFRVVACDLTPAGLVPEARPLWGGEARLWSDLTAIVPCADWVYCTDVLEHLPTQFTMLAVEQMLRVAPRLFLSVSLQPDVNGVWVGRALHQTVQSFVWWREALREVGRVTDARDLLADAVFVVER